MDKVKGSASYRRLALAALVACMCAALFALAGCGSSAASSSAAPASGDAENASSAASSQAEEAQGDATSETVTFEDSAGRTVEVPAQIDRVAVSGPISQMAMLVFAPEKMVGLSNELSDVEMKYVGEEYGSLPVYGQIYGGKGDFNKEAVAAADPQLIIDIGEAKDSIVEDMDDIQEATGIPCVHIEASYNTYDQAFALMSLLMGKEDRATELAEYCMQAVQGTLQSINQIPESDRVKVAYLLGDSGLNAMAKGSFQGTVVDLIADNVAEVENPGGSGLGSEVSFEQIAMWDPEMIVFGPDSIYGTAADDPTWSTLSAIQSGNYYAVPGEPYNWLSSPPGVNQILGVQWFARLCYPDQFEDDIAEVAKNYYKVMYNYDLTDDECNELIADSKPKA